MKLKNILIVVKDIEKSRKYNHDLFGLELVTDRYYGQSNKQTNRLF